MSIVNEISETLQKGRAKLVKELVEKALAEGISPAEILNDGLLAGMNIIGERNILYALKHSLARDKRHVLVFFRQCIFVRALDNFKTFSIVFIEVIFRHRQNNDGKLGIFLSYYFEHSLVGRAKMLGRRRIVIVIVDKCGHIKRSDILRHSDLAHRVSPKAEVDIVAVKRAADNVLIGISGS